MPTGNRSERTGADIAIPLTPRNVGAGLGILASIVTVSYIGFRLDQASAPVATAVVLSSASPTLISLKSLRINDQEVLPSGWTPVVNSQVRPAQAQGSVALQVGRPVSMTAALAVPPGAVASCDLALRPYGACMLKVTFSSSRDMQCEYECSTAVQKP